MTVMLDTNIIISAGLFGGSQLTATTLRIADEFRIVLSSDIIMELWTLMDKKFPRRKPVMERFLKHLSYEISYTPTEIDTDYVARVGFIRRQPYLNYLQKRP